MALSTTEVKYIKLSQKMPNVIPFMALNKELSFILDINFPKEKLFCKVFKANQSCIAVAESNKLSPRAKRIAIKYHNFRSFV